MIAFALAAAATLASLDASAFDNKACKTFLTGTWDMAVATDSARGAGRIATRASYGANGAFAATVRVEPADLAPTEMALSGSWSAAPGPSTDSCRTDVTVDGHAPVSATLIVLDGNTVRDTNGGVATRVTVTATAP
ncbi:hypothetical protein sos41_01760 [Alphaproteobacteria bacterium SO-S41]|nr:hypothetical protein sos41_01760 [Alphaproteobacteria bacterium SO-S41]